jgi:hypothetical protein
MFKQMHEQQDREKAQISNWKLHWVQALAPQSPKWQCWLCMCEPAPDLNRELSTMLVDLMTLGDNQNNDPTCKIANAWPQNEPPANNEVNKLAEKIRKLGKAEKHALLKRLIPNLATANTMELEDLSVWACVLHPEALYISNQNFMHIPFTFENVHRKAKECTMLDSSMTENFMDWKMVS